MSCAGWNRSTFSSATPLLFRESGILGSACWQVRSGFVHRLPGCREKVAMIHLPSIETVARNGSFTLRALNAPPRRSMQAGCSHHGVEQAEKRAALRDVKEALSEVMRFCPTVGPGQVTLRVPSEICNLVVAAASYLMDADRAPQGRARGFRENSHCSPFVFSFHATGFRRARQLGDSSSIPPCHETATGSRRNSRVHDPGARLTFCACPLSNHTPRAGALISLRCRRESP